MNKKEKEQFSKWYWKTHPGLALAISFIAKVIAFFVFFSLLFLGITVVASMFKWAIRFWF